MTRNLWSLQHNPVSSSNLTAVLAKHPSPSDLSSRTESSKTVPRSADSLTVSTASIA